MNKKFYCPNCGDRLDVEDFDFDEDILECEGCGTDLEFKDGEFVEYVENEEDSYFDFFNTDEAIDLFNEYLDEEDEDDYEDDYEDDDSEKVLAASAIVKLSHVKNNAVVKFIKRLMSNNGFNKVEIYEKNGIIYIAGAEMEISEYECPVVAQCGVLLNTYLKGYFSPLDFIDEYDIYCQIVEYDADDDAEELENNLLHYYDKLSDDYFDNTLFFNKLLCSLTDDEYEPDQNDEEYEEIDETIPNIEEVLEEKVEEYK